MVQIQGEQLRYRIKEEQSEDNITHLASVAKANSEGGK